jgi:hypothetical protein
LRLTATGRKMECWHTGLMRTTVKFRLNILPSSYTAYSTLILHRIFSYPHPTPHILHRIFSIYLYPHPTPHTLSPTTTQPTPYHTSLPVRRTSLRSMLFLSTTWVSVRARAKMHTPEFQMTRFLRNSQRPFGSSLLRPR